MPLFDLPLAQLREYRPDVREPDDFDDFWVTTLAESRSVSAEPTLVPYGAGLSEVDIFDVTFAGFGGQPVKAWLKLPRTRSGPLPTIVEYNGYGGGRGLPHERLAWVAAGYAYLFMDTRGQGSAWGAGGSTPDDAGTGPSSPGFMTRGIESPEGYYYRRVYTDAVRAVDALRTLDVVDSSRITVCGGSQGGGISIAVAGLVPDLLAAMPDVPFLCHFERAVSVTPSQPFTEITRYLSVHRGLAEQTFTTLSYFDGVNFAARARCDALFSVALMDDIVPPSTVFAAYNRYAGDAQIEVYPFNGHEGGDGHQWVKQSRWLAERVAVAG